jgi:DNA-directed RNA polymerase subunit N (RpoN/RPB10)
MQEVRGRKGAVRQGGMIVSRTFQCGRSLSSYYSMKKNNIKRKKEEKEKKE